MLNVVNNELIVGGIFCIMDRTFDWVDRGIILSKLYFYGVNGKDHALNLIWITSILEQQCIMAMIIVIKFQAGSKLDIESQKTLFWDLYFFFCK